MAYEFQNKSFEDWPGGNPDPWVKYGYYGGSQKMYRWQQETDPALVVDGSSSFKFGAYGYNAHASLTQDIDPKAYLGKTIPITIWCYGWTTGRTRFGILSDGTGGSGTQYYYPSVQYQWEQLGGDYTIADDATFLRIQLYISRNYPGWGYNWWDFLEIPSMAPTITTDPATQVGVTSAILNGTLDEQGAAPAYCGFEWGPDTSYGTTTAIQTKTTGETFSQALAGLQPGTTYHFRAFATNPVGTSYGTDRSFTTAPVITKAYALAREEL